MKDEISLAMKENKQISLATNIIEKKSEALRTFLEIQQPLNQKSSKTININLDQNLVTSPIKVKKAPKVKEFVLGLFNEGLSPDEIE